MSKRCGMAVIGVLAAMSLTSVPIASAATEVGSNCAANKTAPNFTFIQLAKGPSNPLPLTVPSAGVVTKWKVNSEPFEGMVSLVLKALRSAGAPLDFRVIDESRPGNVHGGQNTFDTRIPVLAGDRFGLFGAPVTFYCQSASTVGEAFGFSPGNVLFGSTQTFGESKDVQVPVSAIVEADADADGYGDETQDRCPQSAAYQGECPAIALDAFPIVLKRSVLVLVSASSSSSVHVFGQVGWKAKPAAGARSSKAKPGGGPATTGLIVGLAADTQTVNPGEVAKFNVKLPKSVKRRLGQIPPSKSLKGQLTASTTDLAGRVSTRVLTVKLPGQDRR